MFDRVQQIFIFLKVLHFKTLQCLKANEFSSADFINWYLQNFQIKNSLKKEAQILDGFLLSLNLEIINIFLQFYTMFVNFVIEFAGLGWFPGFFPRKFSWKKSSHGRMLLLDMFDLSAVFCIVNGFRN